MKTHRPSPRGLLALSPMFILGGLFLSFGVGFGDFYAVPLLLVFILTAAYALAVCPRHSFRQRLAIFSRGAGSSGLLLMVWIFVLAGAFAESAREMGAIEATVNAALNYLPPRLLLTGIFVAACFISLSIGTSVGTIVALTPVAAGLSAQAGLPVAAVVAAAVGGAFFGDNLSFISDTTVAATRTQGCRLSDKFRVNFRIVLPAAVVCALVYALMGASMPPATGGMRPVEWLKVLPYLFVLAAAVAGMDVIIVLFLGNVLTGVVGLLTGGFDATGWLQAMATGVQGMSELILISMLAGGLLEIIRSGGGITYIIRLLTLRVQGKRGAEGSIAALVALTNLCTANNTVAILSVGQLASDISAKYGIDPRKSASILDTFSCIVQAFIPYGAQLLMAAGLAALNPVEIIPYLYYPMLLAVMAVLSILLRYPKRYS